MNFNETRRNSSFLEGTQETFSMVNERLRAYLLRVYQLMGLGLLVSALTAFLGTTEAIKRLLLTVTPQGYAYTLLGWVAIIAPFILVFMFHSAITKMNLAKAQTIFWIFSALMGFSFTAILMPFTAESLFQTFVVAAGSFGALCLYGYTTRRDLTGFGAFAQMGLWGIIFAVIINWFIQSSALSYTVSIIGVFVFAGLTTFDMQKIKMMYSESDSNEMTQTKAIYGALTLYLDFINLFMMLLQFTGNRK